MNRAAIIDQVAGEADDFLEGFYNRTDARAGIFEQLNIEYGALPPAEHQKIADGVMTVLEAEGFFEGVPDSSSQKPGADEEE